MTSLDLATPSAASRPWKKIYLVIYIFNKKTTDHFLTFFKKNNRIQISNFRLDMIPVCWPRWCVCQSPSRPQQLPIEYTRIKNIYAAFFELNFLNTWSLTLSSSSLSLRVPPPETPSSCGIAENINIISLLHPFSNSGAWRNIMQ